MEKYFNSPAEVVEANMKGAEGKAALSVSRMVLLGILAGEIGRASCRERV